MLRRAGEKRYGQRFKKVRIQGLRTRFVMRILLLFFLPLNLILLSYLLLRKTTPPSPPRILNAASYHEFHKVHPIPSLLEAAEKRWKTMYHSQSNTLDQAITEYERRYSRRPPKGFDIWFHWAKSNNVHFVDEYDRIDKDLHLFWKISAKELRRRAVEQLGKFSYIVIQKGKFTMVNRDDGGIEMRLRDLIQLLEMFPGDLPDIALPIDARDRGLLALSWESRHELLTGEVMPTGGALDAAGYYASTQACPPESPARQYFVDDSVSWPAAMTSSDIFRKTIDHNEASDICHDPSVRYLHGTFLHDFSIERFGSCNASNFYPLTSWSATSTAANIRIPVTARFEEDLPAAVPWSEKNEDRLYWRGSTGGIYNGPLLDWEQSHRPRLIKKTSSKTGWSEVWIPTQAQPLTMQKTLKRNADLNEKFTNIRFTSIIQCETGVCNRIRQEYSTVPMAPWEEQMNAKYLIDIDGNGWSGRFRTLLRSGGIVLKHTVFTEWFADTLIPWYHYIPISLDYKDLYSIMAYFVGSGTWPGRDWQAEKIAKQGTDYAYNHWRKEDMASYLIRLSLELGRLYADDRTAETL